MKIHKKWPFWVLNRYHLQWTGTPSIMLTTTSKGQGNFNPFQSTERDPILYTHLCCAVEVRLRKGPTTRDVCCCCRWYRVCQTVVPTEMVSTRSVTVLRTRKCLYYHDLHPLRLSIRLPTNPSTHPVSLGSEHVPDPPLTYETSDWTDTYTTPRLHTTSATPPPTPPLYGRP